MMVGECPTRVGPCSTGGGGAASTVTSIDSPGVVLDLRYSVVAPSARESSA